MLAYLITQALQKRWALLELTVAGGIAELSSLCSVEITVDKLSYQQIPEPRQMEKILFLSLPSFNSSIRQRFLTAAFHPALHWQSLPSFPLKIFPLPPAYGHFRFCKKTKTAKRTHFES
jgi:hypothetical protein